MSASCTAQTSDSCCASSHIHIPTASTSHPDNPIPTEPETQIEFSMNTFEAVRVAQESKTLSDGAYVAATADDTSDSDDALSTPPTEPHDISELIDKIEDLPTSDLSEKPWPSRRRASTTFASSPDEIKRILGDGNGTKFLQKYCCGKGCCMLEALPTHTSVPGHEPIRRPDNDAFRFLNPSLATLTLDTCLTKVVDLPQSRVSFGPLRRDSIAEKFPTELKNSHCRNAVDIHPPTYMKPHPPYDIFSAPVYGARELTKPGAEKRTYHFDLDVTDYPEEGGVDFKVGGAIGVCPPNDPAVVEDILNQLGILRSLRDKPIRLYTNSGRWPTIWGEDEPRELVTTRRELLTWTVDLSSTAPTKPLFRLLAEHAEATNEKQILLFLCSAQGQAAFCDLRTGPHITLQQLLHAFPSSKPPLEDIYGCLNQLMPRFYSLSNDPHVSSTREGLAGRRLVEIAVTIHETPNFNGSRSGVGSGFLERIALAFTKAEVAAQASSSEYIPGTAGRSLNLQVPMFRGLMSNPLSREFASDGPMVLIGAGVGMAPFRGFILNRLKNANCANKIWLIQGIRDSMLDEIYRGELGDHEHEIKKVVQSRARQPPPISTNDPGVDSSPTDDTQAVVEDAASQQKVAKYVQDEVRLQADIVWFVVNSSDGRIFVCGSTKGMGEGVEKALIDVAMDKGNLDLETAKQFWESKKEAGQYIAETW